MGFTGQNTNQVERVNQGTKSSKERVIARKVVSGGMAGTDAAGGE